MSMTPRIRGGQRYAPPRQRGSRLRRWRRRFNEISDARVTVVFVLAVLVTTVWAFLDYRNVRVPAVAVIIMVLGALTLTTRAMIGIIALLSAAIVIVWALGPSSGGPIVTLSGLVMLLVVATASILQVYRRQSLGLRRTSAESVLARVRQRLRAQAEPPALPLGWRVATAQVSAGRAAFAGDFVSTRVHDVCGAPTLEIAMVDVSGRGFEAGSRALLLSGVVGGLLGEVAPDDLLPAANHYLLRQNWGFDYATAVYVRVRLSDGRYEVRNAGHPPVVISSRSTSRRSAGQGTVLGVVPDLGVVAESGHLGPGEALVVYTDGLVERRDRTIDVGIGDLETAIAATLRSRPMEDLPHALVSRSDLDDDDRTVLVAWNDGSLAHPVTTSARVAP